MITESFKAFGRSYHNLPLYLNPLLRTAVVCLLTKNVRNTPGLIAKYTLVGYS